MRTPPEDHTDPASGGRTDPSDATSGPEAVPERSTTAGRGRIARGRQRFDATAASFTAWFDRRRVEAVPFDLAASFYERDRDTFASVLGAALAMRLFLFLVPLLAFVIGAVLALFGSDGMDSVLQGAGVTGTIAQQIRAATDTTRAGGLALMASAIVLALWAGRSLTRVLAACSAGAWQVTGRDSRATARMVATVTGLVALLIALLAFMNRVREDFGVPFATTSWLATVVLLSVAWFVVSWSLPRRTSDPGALLPGAVLTGLALAGLQWVMQYYLPGRIERASDLTGSLGITLAALGYLFLVGRVMAASLIVNAVVWERVGSITGLVFSLPVVRRIPDRSPRVVRFFDLERVGASSDAHDGSRPPDPAAPGAAADGAEAIASNGREPRG